MKQIPFSLQQIHKVIILPTNIMYIPVRVITGYVDVFNIKNYCIRIKAKEPPKSKLQSSQIFGVVVYNSGGSSGSADQQHVHIDLEYGCFFAEVVMWRAHTQRISSVMLATCDNEITRL